MFSSVYVLNVSVILHYYSLPVKLSTCHSSAYFNAYFNPAVQQHSSHIIFNTSKTELNLSLSWALTSLCG